MRMFQSHGKELSNQKNLQERHQERNETVTSPLEDLQKGGQERAANRKSH